MENDETLTIYLLLLAGPYSSSFDRLSVHLFRQRECNDAFFGRAEGTYLEGNDACCD